MMYRFFIFLFLMLIITAMNIEPALAHTMDIVDDYKIEIAWMKQPRSNTENGVEVFVNIATDADKKMAESMGMSQMNMKKINQIEFSEGISDLDLRAELVRKEKKLSFDLMEDPNAAGRYFAKVTPWLHGNYQVNIIGTIDETNLSIGLHPARVKPMPPIKQLQNGVSITEVICDEDFVLVKKPTKPAVACVKEKTSQILIQRRMGISKLILNSNLSQKIISNPIRGTKLLSSVP